MSSSAISEEFEVPLLLFSMEQNSPLENTIAAFRTKNIKKLSWTDVPFDLIAGWKSVRTEKSSSHSSDPKPNPGKIAKAVSTKKGARFGNVLRDFYGKEAIQHKNVLSILTRPTADFVRNLKNLCRLPSPKIARKRAEIMPFEVLRPTRLLLKHPTSVLLFRSSTVILVPIVSLSQPMFVWLDHLETRGCQVHLRSTKFGILLLLCQCLLKFTEL